MKTALSLNFCLYSNHLISTPFLSLTSGQFTPILERLQALPSMVLNTLLALGNWSRVTLFMVAKYTLVTYQVDGHHNTFLLTFTISWSLVLFHLFIFSFAWKRKRWDLNTYNSEKYACQSHQDHQECKHWDVTHCLQDHLRQEACWESGNICFMINKFHRMVGFLDIHSPVHLFKVYWPQLLWLKE